tara:strand:+ start:170 stop:781 length:612 start_codon:yes stop_codon:yes gene_type:complete
MSSSQQIKNRFRTFLPIVIDVETGGLDAQNHALLELAASYIAIDDKGKYVFENTEHYHIHPHPHTYIDPASLAINNIVPENPLRFASKESEALKKLFKNIETQLTKHKCTRAILVGHNPTFDLGFIKAAVKRNNLKNNPFHKFTTFDTATLGGLVYGETVLAKALQKANIEFDESQAHGALYDTEKTAELFCTILNEFPFLPL